MTMELFLKVCRVIIYGSIGVIIGIKIVDTNIVDRVRFSLWPVVEMHGIKVPGPANGVVLISLQGEKKRGSECIYKGVAAFGDRISGLPVDLNIQRIDKTESGETRDRGTYDMGIWKIWPVSDIYRIRVKIAHLCGSSRISTEIANITLS